MRFVRWGEDATAAAPRRLGPAGGVAIAALLISPAPAPAAVGHVVQPGETLWSIAYANNLTTRTVAVYNGLSEDAQVVAGDTIEVPTVAEGAAALAAAGPAPSTEPASSAEAPPSAEPASSGPPPFPYGTIPSPFGDLYLSASAASAWNSMRSDALASYGVDLYPGGPLSAYRSYAQQDYLYRLFVSGQGAPANPPGSSFHELGVAVDLATPEMRSVVDALGPAYCWYPYYDSEWWHVQYECA